MRLYQNNDARAAARIAVHLPASVRERGRARSPAKLIDISVGGCRLELAQQLTPGTWVWLTVGGIETQYCRVVWARDMFVGLEFCVQLHQAVLDRLVGNNDNVSSEALETLKETSRRCRVLATRATDGTATHLNRFADDCSRYSLVQVLRRRFG